MSKNNVTFRLERYDKVFAIAFDGNFSPSSISKGLANFVGNYRHNAPLTRLYRILRGCGGSKSTSKAH
jgi:hypothetical protein